MIFLPIFLRHEESRCPNCSKIESLKDVCRHCNYEYPEEDLGILPGTLILGGFISVILGIIFLTPEPLGYFDKKSFIDYAMGGMLGIAAYGLLGVVILLFGFMIESLFGKRSK